MLSPARPRQNDEPGDYQMNNRVWIAAVLMCSLAGCSLFEKSSSPTSPSSSLVVKQFTMAPGTGFVFESGLTTSGNGSDRDIWWNGFQVDPARLRTSAVRMITLGTVADIRNVQDLKTASMTSDPRIPQVGEVFALEIRRPETAAPQNAVIRFTQISPSLSFEFIYPR